MKLEILDLNWDSGNWPKCGNHGVTKKEIEEVFKSAPFIIPDPHPDEPRMRAIGKTKAGRYVFLAFMFRLVDEQTAIRPISARYMHQKEIEYYEKTQTNAINQK